MVHNMVLVVADTDTTNHMCPEWSEIISHHPVTNISVRMGIKALVPVLGKGTALISLNGKLILVRNVLHVPTLRTPLYSLRKHLTQRGCGFLCDDSLRGLFVSFPNFVLAVDTTKDCHLSYKPVGRKAALHNLDYFQTWCALNVLPPSQTPLPQLPSEDWQAM